MPDTVNEYVVSYFNEFYNERGEKKFGDYKSARVFATGAKRNFHIKDVSLAQITKTITVLPEQEWLIDTESSEVH